MNQFFKRSVPFLASLGLVLGGCQPDLMDDPSSSAGQADFSRYVAVGNSLTAGYGDNGLYLEGQLASYPNILSQQFARVGGGPFVQPLFTTAQSNGSGYLTLTGFTPATANALSSPITAFVLGNAGRGTGAAASAPYTKFTDPVNNLGIPGIRMSDIQTAGYGSTQGNAFFERITTNPAQTYLQRVQETVASIKLTFFTEWLGNNDVLGYATAGGAASTITPTATFTANTNLILDALTAGGAKGLVATIPDVTNIPFFTTVGPSFRATLALPANNVPSAAPFVYTTGTLAPSASPTANARVSTTLASIRDASGTGNLLLTLTASPYLSLYGRPGGKYWRDFYRQATGTAPTGPAFSGFLLGLGVDTTRAFGQTTQNPFPSTLVLDATEQTAVATATTAFNTTLTTAAQARNLAVFDANTFFRGVASNGIITNGIANNASFISGNLFSLDGVHPTPRGYAVVANEMIRAINAKYGASVPGVDATLYRGVKFP